MPLTPGTRLGPFAIQSLLGSGGMGEVYRARDTKLDRDVALKLLPAELAHDTERLRRFQQEARSASALNHPAIVVIYDFGKIAAQPYISMELVEGQTLRQMLQAGAMPPRRALQVAAPIADGLAKAHEAGIVHRDLKPENLMVSHDGFAKILDFGLAKLVDEVTGRSTVPTTSDLGTRAGSVIGTVGYMSPEQASGGPADYRSDQFSLGLVVFEMLTGQRAFHRPTAAETLSAIIREDPPTLGHLNPSVPAPLQWIVERCLAKNPSDRYGSTRDLARDLASARDHFSELTSSAASPLPPVARAGRVKTRELAAWSLVAALLVTTAVLALRPGAPPPAADRPLRFAISPPENVTFESPFGMSPFALSPDGRHLVFVGRGRDGRGLWLHSFDSLVSRPLAGTQGAFGAFWSPDGRAVAFFTPDRLKRVSIDGGEVATICEARWGGGGTWNRDGVIVFAPGIESALFRVAATGGVPTPITELDAAGEEGGHIGPLFLPDGRHFVFSVYGGKAMGTYVAALDAPGRTRLPLEPSLLGFSAPDFLFFMRERVLMAQRLDLTRLELTGEALRVADGIERLGPGASFAVSASGTLADRAGARDITQATWFRRDGTAAGTLGHPAASMNIAVSADGRQAAVDWFDDAPGIWLLDAARGTETRATFGKIYESTPVWSPDGTAFAYASAELAPPTLYVKPLGSAAAGQRLFGTADQTLFPQSWSPDGRLLAYASSNAETQVDIWVLDLSGEPRPRPLLQTTFSETHARISPDGRWMAYASNESGRQNVYVTRFPEPGAKWPVSTSGGGHPVWRRDGRELFYRAPGGVLMAVPVTAGADFSAGAPIALFQPRVVADTLGYGTFYDVAPDGRFLINIVVEQTSPPATVVINWRAANAPPEG